MKEVNIKKVSHLYRILYLLLFIFITALCNETIKMVSEAFFFRIIYYLFAFVIFSIVIPYLFFRKKTIDSESIKDFSTACKVFVVIIITLNFLINILVQAANYDHYIEVTDNLRQVSQGVENSFYYRNSGLIENSIEDRRLGGEVYDWNYAFITVFDIIISVLCVNLIQNKIIIKLTNNSNQGNIENGKE